MALISSSENPLARRLITVDGICPDLKPCIAVTMSAGLRPTRRGTVVSTKRAAGWQPEQEAAPGGASAGPAAKAVPIIVRTNAAAVMMRVPIMSEYSTAMARCGGLGLGRLPTGLHSGSTE